MRRKPAGMAKKAGSPPGSVLHIGREYTQTARIQMVTYDSSYVKVKELSSAADLSSLSFDHAVTWIHIRGLQNTELIAAVCDFFHIHALVQEDIVNSEHRPKIEDYTDYLFMMLNTFWLNEETDLLENEQISFVLGASYLISFQETDRNLFDPMVARINNAQSRIRKEGADYLAYALIDVVVDNYFIILETLGEKIETVEEDLVTQPNADALKKIHVLKREMLFFRKAVWPLREVIGFLSRGEAALLKSSTLLYMRDVYDHTVQIIDTLETYRDMVSGMLDIYLSSISIRMNEIMKLLTVISTIFIPLTFIVGVYGMNFDNMPELRKEWGYFILWGVMLSIALGMLRFFRKRKWL